MILCHTILYYIILHYTILYYIIVCYSINTCHVRVCVCIYIYISYIIAPTPLPTRAVRTPETSNERERHHDTGLVKER